MSSPRTPDWRWRVCSTRDEPVDGPLAQALRSREFDPVSCPLLRETPPADQAALAAAAKALDDYDWVVCASVRAVSALTRARSQPWPPEVRTAAVGLSTASALISAGAMPHPLAHPDGGADALWSLLQSADHWQGRRVLVPTTPGGRRTLIDHLRFAGAIVDEVEAYRMEARPAAAIARDWTDAAPEAAVVASPTAAAVLADAVGPHTLAALRAVVAIGATTASALAALAVPCLVPARAGFEEVAETLAAHRAGEAPR